MQGVLFVQCRDKISISRKKCTPWLKKVHTLIEKSAYKTLENSLHYLRKKYLTFTTSKVIFTSVIWKKILASQPTMSRFIILCDDISLTQFEKIQQELRRRNLIYSETCADFDWYLFYFICCVCKQEGTDYNHHYSNDGYHPLLA